MGLLFGSCGGPPTHAWRLAVFLVLSGPLSVFGCKVVLVVLVTIVLTCLGRSGML